MGLNWAPLKLDGYSKWPKTCSSPRNNCESLQFSSSLRWYLDPSLCQSSPAEDQAAVSALHRRPEKPSASLNRSTDPSGKATREKVDVEAETAEACDTVMLTGLFASPWKQNEMNFKSYSCGESSENLEFEAGRLVQLGFFARFHQGQRCLFSNCDLGPKSFSQILHGHSKSKPVKSLFPWRHGLPSKKKVVFPVGVFP